MNTQTNSQNNNNTPNQWMSFTKVTFLVYFFLVYFVLMVVFAGDDGISTKKEIDFLLMPIPSLLIALALTELTYFFVSLVKWLGALLKK